MIAAYKETDVTIRIRPNRYYSAEYRIAVHPTIRPRSEYEANIRYSPRLDARLGECMCYLFVSSSSGLRALRHARGPLSICLRALRHARGPLSIGLRALRHARGPLSIGLRALRHARGPAGPILTSNQHTHSPNHASNHPFIQPYLCTLTHTSIHPPIH